MHPDLCNVVRLAHSFSSIPFVVIAGLRSPKDEAIAVLTGKSETLHSRHLKAKSGYACAVDVMALSSNKADWVAKDYQPIAAAMFLAAHNLGHVVEWGGDWKTLKDWGHFQLPWALYP